MDVVNLLHEAEDAGLRLEVRGDHLVVHGPQAAAPVVQKLASERAAVIRALKPRWSAAAQRLVATCSDVELAHELWGHFEERAAVREYLGELRRAEAEMLAFGELVTEMLRRGINVRAVRA